SAPGNRRTTRGVITARRSTPRAHAIDNGRTQNRHAARNVDRCFVIVSVGRPLFVASAHSHAAKLGAAHNRVVGLELSCQRGPVVVRLPRATRRLFEARETRRDPIQGDRAAWIPQDHAPADPDVRQGATTCGAGLIEWSRRYPT